MEAANRGAQVINLSLGGTGGSTVLKNAVEYARSKVPGCGSSWK